MLGRFSRQALRVATRVPQSSRAASTSVLALDEEFPGLPHLGAGQAHDAKVEVSSLPSGVKVVSTAAGKSTSVGLAIQAGSQYEAPTEYGSAHILQHLAFKGTSKRSALRILRDLESVGSVPSASAGRETVLYKVTSLPDYAEASLNAAFETAFSPKVTDYIVHELQHFTDADLENLAASPELQLTEALYEAAYGENTPLGHPFYTTASRKVCSQVLKGFISKTFVGPSISVVGTGIPHAQLLAWASELTSSIPKASIAGPPASKYVGGEARLKAESESTYVSLALPAAKADAAALAVLTQLWSTALPPGASTFTLPGLVGVTGVTAAASAGAYVESLAKVIKSAPTDKLEAAKTAAKLTALTKADGQLFEAIATGAWPLGIDAVSATDVKGLADKISKAGLTIASLGDVSKVPKKSQL